MATILSTADLAAALDTTPRTLRKFLRSDASGIDGVGKGSRYSIEAKQVRSLRSRFAKWAAEVEAKRNEREATADAADDATDAPAE
jgi:hypothetical protein